MKGRWLRWIVATGLVWGLGGVAVAHDEGKRSGKGARTDARLEERIEGRLKKQARIDDVEVDVEGGVVTLRGTVARAADRERAERLARVEGVTRIENRIEVAGAANGAAVRSGNGEDGRDEGRTGNGDEARTRGERAADRGRAAADEAGDELSDAWITTRIKAQFIGEDVLEGSDISVDTERDGVVTLTGTVPSAAAKARAVEIARETKGVRKVDDRLKVTERR